MKIGDKNIEKVVLDSTKSLLLRYGVKGWNMDDLASECGMSKRTLYKIIGNKEDLLYRCYADGIEGNSRSLRAFLNQDKDYCALLDGLANQMVMGIEDFIVAGSKTIKTEYPRISAMIDAKVNSHREIFIGFFDKGKAEGFLKDNVSPKIIKNIINALMDFTISNSKNKAEFEAKIKEELIFLFQAIRK